jgi:hypothetical protein
VLSSSPGARTATGRTETKRLVSLLPALGVSEKIRKSFKSIDPEAEDSIRI